MKRGSEVKPNPFTLPDPEGLSDNDLLAHVHIYRWLRERLLVGDGALVHVLRLVEEALVPLEAEAWRRGIALGA